MYCSICSKIIFYNIFNHFHPVHKITQQSSNFHFLIFMIIFPPKIVIGKNINSEAIFQCFEDVYYQIYYIFGLEEALNHRVKTKYKSDIKQTKL